jgi:signal transduction histidine kinase
MGWCLVELNAAFIRDQFLPALVKRYFSGAGLSDYRLAVVTGDSRRVLYTSDPALTSSELSSVDAATILLRSQSPFGPDRFDSGRESDPAVTANASMDTWQLVAKHEMGSIQTAVNATRRRNLGIGFGILALVGSGTALLMWNAHRARALAQREMEFVAGVSHELRTPLSVIQSAGFNLASGRVKDSDRVQQYGTTIQNESRRLSDMIEQMLSYAGIQSGRKQYEFQPTPISDVIDRALGEYATTFNEAGWQVEKNVEETVPLISADAQALESAIKNLLYNALKYAAEGKWLRVSDRASSNSGKPEVEVTVEDRGPGIDPQDLPHIFDPFYRGRGVVASAIPGAGLGLSLVQRHVQAHRGRVTVKTSPGQGTTFTIHLPALSHSGNENGR